MSVHKSFIVLTPYSGIDGLVSVALEFAENRLSWGTKVVQKQHKNSTPAANRLRRKVAVRALVDARQQIKAAIALLEVDAE